MPALAISALTPVWNVLQYVREFFDSVLSRDFHELELVINDYKTTNGTRDYRDNLKDPWVRMYKQSVNFGIDDTLNLLSKSTMAPIADCLCDDYFSFSALKIEMNALMENGCEPLHTAVSRETLKQTKVGDE
ncbi:MAG: glycosyltransferase [Chryseolinea sp.]